MILAKKFWAAICAFLGAILITFQIANAQRVEPEFIDLPKDSYVRNSIYVPVRDGTKLAVNIYRPALNGVVRPEKMPTIFMFTPYRARFFEKDGTINDRVTQNRRGFGDFLAAGYNIVYADIRGKGASFGFRRGFQDRTEAQDGYDLIQWAAAQNWSTGNVGMYGCSYLGGTTFQVATTRPPALKAIFAGATDIDKYSFVRRGGIPAQFNTRPDEPAEWDLQTVPMDEDATGDMLRAAVAQHAQNTPMADLWYSMPFRDSVSSFTNNAFWEEVAVYRFLDAIKRPGLATYFWSNWEDEPAAHSILSALNTGGKLLMGPGSHCIPPANFDLSQEIIRYFDYHLKGIQNGINNEPKYTYFVDNAENGNKYVKSNLLPGQGVNRTAFYLANQGNILSTQKPRSGQTKFKVNYDVGNPEYFAYWVNPQDDKGVYFTSEAFTEDKAIIGFPIARIRASVDKSDANMFAYLEDVSPNGVVKVFSFGRLAFSHNKTSRAPYNNLDLPYHSGLSRDVAPVVANRAVNMHFDLTPSSWVVKRGHKIRFVITGADPRQRNLQQIRQTPEPNITIYHGSNSGSRLEVPMISASSIQ